MWDILFGWRKASKCKKLIRRVQCRLKLLKNKRCCIVKQLRMDVAQLLKHGHDQTAFDRVEQIVKDEAMVEVYDLLGNFCEFIIINLPYIRKHKDCPSDINEAVSTLVFSSERFGELPELLSIRKLFGERYGQRFLMSALDGNLVNIQIQESLYIRNVADDVKYRLLEEIATTCNDSGPLLLEYKPFWQEGQANNGWSNRISSRDVSMEIQNGGLQLQIYNPMEAEIGKIVHVDLSSEIKNVPEGNLKRDHDKEMDDGMITGAESSSENSARLPQEMIYLDDIEEIVSPVNKDGNLKDQRLFVFKTFEIPLKKQEKEMDRVMRESSPEEELYEKSMSKNSRKARRGSSCSRKRTRRRLVCLETDIESTMYYGDTDESPPDHEKKRSHCQRQSMNESPAEDNRRSYGAIGKENGLEHKCSLDNPCYNICCRDGKSQCWIPKMKSSKIVHSLVEEKTQNGLRFDKDSYRSEEEKEKDAAHGRETDENNLDNIFRSKSFPLEQARISNRSTCRHIHPKLPDYDELAEKFMALKRENLLRIKRQSECGTIS